MLPKTITPTELRNNLYGVVREIASEGHRYLITPSEGDAVVMCSREDYNALVAERQLLRDLREAEAHVGEGRTHTIHEVRAFLVRERGAARARGKKRERKVKTERPAKRQGTPATKGRPTKRPSA